LDGCISGFNVEGVAGAALSQRVPHVRLKTSERAFGDVSARV